MMAPPLRQRSPLSQRLHAGHLLLAALGAVLVALVVRAVLVPPQPPLPLPLPPVSPPVVADAALLARADPFFPQSDQQALPVTSLPFTLHGLRTDSASGRGSAIIAGADGVQAAYAVGEDLGGGVLLAAVAFDHVVLERDGQRELLWLDAAGPGEGAAALPDMPTDAPITEPPPPEGLPPPARGAAELPAAPPEGESLP